MPESSSHPRPPNSWANCCRSSSAPSAPVPRWPAKACARARTTPSARCCSKSCRAQGDNCRHLLNCLNHLGLEPNRDTGAFYAKAMAIEPLEERLQFVDRGQQWVIRTLREHLPGGDDALIRAELEEVLRIHEQNSAAAHN